MTWHDLTDFIWPTLETLKANNAQNEKDQHQPQWTGELREAQQEAERLITIEDDRLKAVEVKLQAVLNVAPIIITLVLALVTFITQKAQSYVAISVVLIVAGGAYVALQFLRAVFAAIDGIGRKQFLRLTIDDIHPQTNESPETYRLRILHAQLSCSTHNSKVTNDKVSQLALAHRAIKNALGMLLFLIVALGIVAIFNNLPRPT